MDNRRFDAAIRALAASPSRRRIVTSLIGAVLASGAREVVAGKLAPGTIPAGDPSPIAHDPCFLPTSDAETGDEIRGEIHQALAGTCSPRTFPCSSVWDCCEALDTCDAVPACTVGNRLVYDGTAPVCCLPLWRAGCCNDCDCCGDLVCHPDTVKCVRPSDLP